MPDISVEVSKMDNLFYAEMSFNLIKTSYSLTMIKSLEEFIEKLKQYIGSTFDQVMPVPGRSSADVQKFQPVELRVRNSDHNPVSEEDFSAIKTELEKVEAEWHDQIVGLLEDRF